MGRFSLLWEIFPTQGLNPGFLHCRWILYQLSHCSLQSVWNTNTIAISPTHPPSYEFYVKCQFTQLLFLNRSCYRHSRCQYNSILAQNVIWNECENHPVVLSILWPLRLYSTWNSPVQNTWLGFLSLLQVIFPTQGSTWGLLHCRRILQQLSYQGSMIYSYFKLEQQSLKCSCWSRHIYF